MAWDLACRDWEDKLRKGFPPVPDLPLFRSEADRAVAIFNRLRLPDVRGTPTFAEAGGNWFQNGFVAPLMGSYDPVKKVRMIREIFGLVPKKNSKTTDSAGLILVAILMNRRPRADFIYVGPTQEVAQLAFDQTVGMIRLDQELSPQFHVQEHKKQISYRGMEREGWQRPEDRWIIAPSKLKIKSFDPKVMTGVKPAGVLLDEIHAVSQSDADRVVGQARGGLESQPEGFLIIITTQSERQPAGVFKAELKKARAIRDGDLQMADVPMLPVIYEFPVDMVLSGAWRNPDNWPMVLPNLGRSVHLASLKQAKEAAEFVGEEEFARWASQHLNIEIGLTLRSDRWAGAEFWEARGDKTLTLDTLIERSEVIVIEIDGGGLDDLLGLAVLGRDANKQWLLWNHAWAHASVLERRKSEAARLRDFSEDLTIVTMPGDDVKAVGDIIERVAASGKLAEKNAIGVDPVGIGQIIDEIVARGIESEQIAGIGQGWKLNGAIKTLERKLADSTLKHAAQPLMNWCVGNAKVEPRGNAILITKQASGTAKIDPLMAAFNAVHLMTMNPTAGGSVYSAERGLLIVAVGGRR